MEESTVEGCGVVVKVWSREVVEGVWYSCEVI